MRFICKEIGLSVEMGKELIDEIYLSGLAHYPNEFGGVLVGRYSEDKKMVYINDTILPSTYLSSNISFDRGDEGLKEKLSELFIAKPSIIYVGEWHTHPNAAPVPSKTDIRALQQIVNSGSVNINNPVMLIVGLIKNQMQLGLYVYFNDAVHSYTAVSEDSVNKL